MANERAKQKQAAWHWMIVVLCILLCAAIVGAVLLNIAPGKNVQNYEECKAAGGTIAESYPEQCMINGKTFVNNGGDSGNATNADEPKGYVGLSEEDALAKAKSENKPARVVERNGEALPVTMDFVVGRLNLTVNNGKVEKVEVEGE